MRPTVSIVIPTFNRCDLLFTPIQSVLSQSFTNWELIIVDDGSNDGTEALLQKYMLNDTRIRFIKRPSDRPKGANACRNIGIENTKGKYIAFLDSDDEWNCKKLSEEVSFIGQHPEIKALYSGVQIDDGLKRYNGPARDLMENESYVDYIFSDDVLAQTSTFVVKREEALLVKFDEGLQRHQDMDFFIRFGKGFGWHFSEARNTIVHWPKGVKRKQHFESMVLFYERYRSEVSSVDKLGRYLVWSWVCARRSDQRYRNYYLTELKGLKGNLNIKYKIFRIMPDVLYFVWIRWRGAGK